MYVYPDSWPIILYNAKCDMFNKNNIERCQHGQDSRHGEVLRFPLRKLKMIKYMLKNKK